MTPLEVMIGTLIFALVIFGVGVLAAYNFRKTPSKQERKADTRAGAHSA
jgi:Tfp pilus assembly protein PilV